MEKSAFENHASACLAFCAMHDIPVETAQQACINTRDEILGLGIEYKPIPAFRFTESSSVLEMCRWFAMALFNLIVINRIEVSPTVFAYMVNTMKPIAFSKLRKANGIGGLITADRADDVIESALCIASGTERKYMFPVPETVEYCNGIVLINGMAFHCNPENIPEIEKARKQGKHILCYKKYDQFWTNGRPCFNVLRHAIALAGKNYVEMTIGQRYIEQKVRSDDGKTVKIVLKWMEQAVPELPEVASKVKPSFDIADYEKASFYKDDDGAIVELDERLKAIFIGMWHGEDVPEQMLIASNMLGRPVGKTQFHQFQKAAIRQARLWNS